MTISREDSPFVASCLQLRARHKHKNLTKARLKSCHPELVRQLAEDVERCQRIVADLQREPDLEPLSEIVRLLRDPAHFNHEGARIVADQIEQLHGENDFLNMLTSRQADLLTGVVNALKGEPPLAGWSHHDAPALAQACVRDAEHLRTILQEMEARAIAAAWLIPADTICGDLQALRDKAKGLLATLRGVASCATCGVCQGAAESVIAAAAKELPR